MRTLAPDQSVALFDSATALLGGLNAALRGQPFPRLGNTVVAGRAARIGGRLPWPLLREIYARIGASEGIDPDRTGDVDLAAVAQWLVDRYPKRRFPALMVGSSNGALSHLAAAMGVPWLPGTVLVPVKRIGDPARPVDAMRFGERYAPALLEANPDVALHHMHDAQQDRLMVARMTYFRLKWQRLPDAYRNLLRSALLPGAPVILVEDESDWPVVRIGDRHVFQPGAQGGLLPEDYLDQPHTPATDNRSPEAEWGADPQFGESTAQWCAENDRQLIRITYRGPQAPAHPVASVLRTWYRQRGENARHLIVPTFIIGDPWLTLNTASVPFWAFFSVQPALASLADHLDRSDPYEVVRLLLFQHGADSPGIARPEDWERVITAHGARADFLGLDRPRFPHDIAFLGRYGSAIEAIPRAERLWEALPVDQAVQGLAEAGLAVGTQEG